MNKDNSRIKYDNIIIPDSIDTIIIDATNRAHKTKILKYKYISIVASIFITFILAINMFPSVAAAINQIPAINAIAELFKYNKGIQQISSNGYIQNVEKYVIYNGIKFTINQLALDEKKLYFTYTIEDNSDSRTLYPGEIGVNDSNGGWLGLAHQINSGSYTKGTTSGTFELDNFKEYKKKLDSSKLTILCSNIIEKTNDGFKKIQGMWKINVDVNNRLVNVEPVVYNKEKTCAANDIKFTIRGAKIFPSVTEVKIEAVGRDIQLFDGFKNIHISDNNGQTYRLLSIIPETSENKIIYTMEFESSYFLSPKDLFISWDGIYKKIYSEKYTRVDLKNKKILNSDFDKVYYREHSLLNNGFKDLNGSLIDQNEINLKIDIYDEEIVNNEISSNLYNPFGSTILECEFLNDSKEKHYLINYRTSLNKKGGINLDMNILLPKGNLLPDSLKIKYSLPQLIITPSNIKLD